MIQEDRQVRLGAKEGEIPWNNPIDSQLHTLQDQARKCKEGFDPMERNLQLGKEDHLSQRAHCSRWEIGSKGG